MFKKRFLWLMIIAAFVLCASSLFAQAPAGPEKIMIFNGEQLKVQLDGQVRLDMVQNQYDVYNDSYPLWVNNQKWGFALNNPYLPAPLTQSVGPAGTYSIWLPWQAALRRGSLIFDVRYSKIGLTLQGPGILGGYSFGRFEVDFYGGFGTTSGNVSRQPNIRMRNAFAGLGWKTDVFQAKITFGQFTSLMTPYLAYPVSLSNLPFFERGVLFDWDQGIMLSFVFGTPKFNLMIDADIARAKSGSDKGGTLYPGEGQIYFQQPLATSWVGAGSLYSATLINDERGNGEASKRPAWHGRIAININPAPVFGLTVGVQGHYYYEHAQLTGVLTSTSPLFVRAQDIPSKSLGLQAKLSIWIFTIQGAGWMGENMDNFTAGFGTGYRPNVAGTKNLADKGKGGYAQLYIVGPKVGIPIVLFVGMGQEVKNHMLRMANATPAAITNIATIPGFVGPTLNTYVLSAIGGSSSSITSNSEVGGGLWIYFNQYTKIGYEFGQDVTKFKGVKGTSTSMYHRVAMVYAF
jgi:hypothetical protein